MDIEQKGRQDMKQAWIVGLEKNLKKKPILVSKSAFYLEMRPILFGFLILAKLPFRFNEQGKMEIKLFHMCSFYWLILYGCLSYLGAVDLIALWDLFRKENDFIQIVQQIINFIILSYHFSLPALVFFESGRICAFFNNFASYQDSYENFTDDLFKTKFNRPLRICLCITPFMVAAITFYERNVLFNVVWYHLIFYSSLFLLAFLNLLFWYFSLVEIGSCACSLKNKLKISVGKSCGANEILRYRILWIKLNKLLECAGGSIPFTLLMMTILNHASFVMSAYVLISSLIQGKYDALQFLGIMIVCWSMITLTMEAGHCASQKVNRLFLDTLMETDITDMNDKSLKEFNLFVQVVSKSDSVVTLSGYVSVNRPTLAAILASTVTYLIVLVQFNQ